MEEKVTSKAFEYGVVGIVALVFALAVIVLWRHMLARENKMIAEREAMIKERKDWELQEAKIRLECQERINAAQKMQLEQILALQVSAQKREDDVRKEFADMMEIVETKGAEANAAVAAVMQKFYERFVGPRPRY